MVETVLAKISRIRRITMAIAFSFVICIVGIGSTLAADHHGADHRQAAGHDNDRGRGRSHYESAQPNYYYAPPPNYYSAPEPEYPPSEGINLFFKL
jgi:hypothetical protein